MNKLSCTLFLLLLTNYSFGQENCDCLKELDLVSELITHSKSYKSQIKKSAQQTDFENWKNQIAAEIEQDSLSESFCSGYLQKYISFIDDRHNQIYLTQNHISFTIPEIALHEDFQQQKDEISGIYHAGREQILLQKTSDEVWYGIILKSDAKEWKKGKIRLRIRQTSDKDFELFEFYQNGLLFYQKNIKIADGRIHGTFWNKDNQYFFNKNFEDNFVYKSIDASFDYLGIKSLNRTKTLMKEADLFYRNHLKNLSKENLIIDLRNNGGGSENQAKPLLKAIKKNKNIRHIYVFINFKTASAAESVTLALKKDPRTILVGENSRGMLAYGYGNKAFSTRTKCFGYKVILSTKADQPKLLSYENSGIQPDVYLNNQSDWIEQVMLLK